MKSLQQLWKNFLFFFDVCPYCYGKIERWSMRRSDCTKCGRKWWLVPQDVQRGTKEQATREKWEVVERDRETVPF
jgi:hypothetical protein